MGSGLLGGSLCKATTGFPFCELLRVRMRTQQKWAVRMVLLHVGEACLELSRWSAWEGICIQRQESDGIVRGDGDGGKRGKREERDPSVFWKHG